MNEQRRDPSQQGQQSEHKREAPDGGHDKQHGGERAAEHARQGEKPKTEQSSHQGGGGVRSDHRPQGK